LLEKLTATSPAERSGWSNWIHGDLPFTPWPGCDLSGNEKPAGPREDAAGESCGARRRSIARHRGQFLHAPGGVRLRAHPEGQAAACHQLAVGDPRAVQRLAIEARF